MKTNLKRAIGILLVLIMAAGLAGCGRGLPGPGAQSSDSAELDISLANAEFKWGDVLTFDIKAKNVSEEDITGVRIEASAGDFAHFGKAEISPEAIPVLRPGEEGEFTVSYPTAVISPNAANESAVPRTAINKTVSPFTGTAYEARIGFGLGTYKFTFRPVYSGGGAPAQPAQPTQPAPAAPTELPTGNDRFAFLDLYSDIRDVHVGESAPVTFFAEMMSEYLVSDTVNLTSDADGSVIGQLRDDGAAPDLFANDGIFSGTFNLSSDARRNVSYRASCADIASKPVDICYFNDLTQNDFNTANDIIASIQSLGSFGEVSDFLEENIEIEYSIENEETGEITFTTNAGITCVWDSKFDDGRKGGCAASAEAINAAMIHTASMLAQESAAAPSDNKNIAVIRPFRGSQFQYDDFKDCAEIISENLGGAVTVRDDGSADLEFLKTLGDYGIVLFDSHGAKIDYVENGYTKTDPYLVTGEIARNINDPKYSADVQARRIVIFANSGHVAVGHKFFDHYYSANAFDNTLFFLGTCYSAYNSSIADSLISKGASVVFGYTDTVSVGYCNATLDEIMTRSMTLNKTTAKQAFDNAVARHGAVDPTNPDCAPAIFGMHDYRIAVGSGRIAGVITSNASGEPIRRALMQVFDAEGRLVRELRSDEANGSFEIKRPEGVYSITISAYGYLFRRVNEVTVTAGETTYISDSVMLDPEGGAVAGGYVINTFTGAYVPGAAIRFRPGHDTRTGDYVSVDGAVLELTSDENGEFYTDKLKAGYYTAEVMHEDYITAFVNIVSAGEAVDQALPLTPTIAADQIRIVLTWGEVPYDLDSHLAGPTASGSGRFHIAFYGRTYSHDGTVYADLDRDDTDSYGPEQTTVYKKSSGTYSYYVHDFSNKARSDSNAMARSGAKVVVYFGDSFREFNVPPTAGGTLWHVFDFSFDTGVLTPVNEVSYHNDPNTIGG